METLKKELESLGCKKIEYINGFILCLGKFDREFVKNIVAICEANSWEIQEVKPIFPELDLIIKLGRLE